MEETLSSETLTEENLINDFNSEKYSAADLAKKYNTTLGDIKSKTSKLQRIGKIGYKDRSGKIITKPGEKSPRIKFKEGKKEYSIEKVKMGTLAEMLNDISQESEERKTCISTFHKELLIEVLHKLIC